MTPTHPVTDVLHNCGIVALRVAMPHLTVISAVKCGTVSGDASVPQLCGLPPVDSA